MENQIKQSQDSDEPYLVWKQGGRRSGTGKTSDKINFVNTGGDARNLRVRAEGDAEVSISPSDYLETGKSGFIELIYDSPLKNPPVNIFISYENRSGEQAEYYYEYDEKKDISKSPPEKL